MDTLIHADVFFFVTTVVVIVVGIAFTIALVYLTKVLSDVKEITGQVKEEALLVREDIKGLRSDVKQEGFRAERFLMFFRNLFKKTNTRSKKEAKK
jgi:hypothetical protein